MINWLDILFIAILFFSAAMGWRRGLVRQVFDLAAVVAAYVAALRFGSDFVLWLDQYLPLTRWFPTWFDAPVPPGFAVGSVVIRLLGFFLLFVFVRLLCKVAGTLMHGIFSLPVLGTVNCLGGLALGAVKGLLLGLILLGAVMLLSTAFWQQTLAESVVAQTFVPLWPVIYEQMRNFLLQDLLAAV